MIRSFVSPRALSPLFTLTLVLACGTETGDTTTATQTSSASTGDTSGASTSGDEVTGTSGLTTTASSATTTATPETSTATTTEATAETGAPETDTGDVSSSGGAVCEADASDACTTCMGESCCDDLSACEQDPKCVACVTGTDGTQCESNAETHERVQRYLECRGGPCQTSCIEAEGKSCEEALEVFTPDACTECLEKNCCDAVAACSTNAICWDGCFTNHSPDKCHSDPDGHALYHALVVCVNGGCSAECSG